MHLELVPYAERTRFLHLQIRPEQARYAGRIEDMVAVSEPHIDFHAAVADDQVVAFFKTDRNYARDIPRAPFSQIGFQPGDLGLRGLLVGAQFQGRGYGKSALGALPAYLAESYEAPRVFLTVHPENAAAVNLYRSTGWRDTGAMYIRPNGEQLYMLRLDIGQ